MGRDTRDGRYVMEYLMPIIVAAFAFVLGRSAIIWGTLTFLMGWPIPVLLWLLGAKPKTWTNRLKFFNSLNESLVADTYHTEKKPKDYEDFETVDDLFSQLEKK